MQHLVSNRSRIGGSQTNQRLGKTGNRLIRNEGVGSSEEILRLEQQRGCRSDRRVGERLEFQSRLRVFSPPTHPESGEEDRGVDGTVHTHHSPLASPEVVPPSAGLADSRCPPDPGGSAGN